MKLDDPRLRTASEKVPKFMLKSNPRQDPTHVAGPVKPVLQPLDVPPSHKDLFCFKGGTAGHEGTTAVRNRIPGCGGCGRSFFWFGHYCCLCGDFFVKDFADPRFCSFYPTCWGCLPELPWTQCPDHRSYFTFFPQTARHGPVGLNPKKYTVEELEAEGFSVFRFD